LVAAILRADARRANYHGLNRADFFS